MAIDSSLRRQSGLSRHRNVLSRPERIAKLKERESWTEEDGVLGLPKVGNRKPKAGKKKAKEAEGEAAATAAPGTPAPATAAAAPAKK
ncbi:MAG: hypothetical protein CHACPFDD_01301 [Phycisphaerae bacterium]|nr:hypothetical protein [Phycisphaerae bacterium]